MVIKNPEQFFYASDGVVLKSLDDMMGWLKHTKDESFNSHVNEGKNDFVGWVRIVLKDSVLSKKLEKASSRDEMIDLVEDGLYRKQKKSKTKKALISQIKEAVSYE